MNNIEKYGRNYFLPPEQCLDWTKREYISKAPDWCSVDLRDGNQALAVPMSLEEKLEYFTFLVGLGFKEIEIGFPAASETEYEFARALIERNLIPDDVAVQVLTQSRGHIIEKTFEALRGCKNAIIHLYNSTSPAQRRQVFKKSDDEIVALAEYGAEEIRRLAETTEGNFRYEYSPESFTGTEMEFALRICSAVIEKWQPTPDKKVIINLPVTVELSLPHVYASQIEFMSRHLPHREGVVLSVHPHNDRGCAVADTELALLAGAERVEGTLFGNGERTGNVDLITLALNMYTHGVDPILDFSDIPKITEFYEKTTCMNVGERQPYSGGLVFAAFSGSHQDAIAKGMDYRRTTGQLRWDVPYLPLDPTDIGREYDGDVIRINSQSGKGGISYVLRTRFGLELPTKLRESVGYEIKAISDRSHTELDPEEIYAVFKERYVNVEDKLALIEAHYVQNEGITTTVIVTLRGERMKLVGSGNGRLDAVADAFKKGLGINYSLLNYSEHAMEIGSKSKAMSYVEICADSGKISWGAGLHTDIVTSSISALVSAINRSEMLART